MISDDTLSPQARRIVLQLKKIFITKFTPASLYLTSRRS
jgi:hypothetical protein